MNKKMITTFMEEHLRLMNEGNAVVWRQSQGFWNASNQKYALLLFAKAYYYTNELQGLLKRPNEELDKPDEDKLSWMRGYSYKKMKKITDYLRYYIDGVERLTHMPTNMCYTSQLYRYLHIFWGWGLLWSYYFEGAIGINPHTVEVKNYLDSINEVNAKLNEECFIESLHERYPFLKANIDDLLALLDKEDEEEYRQQQQQ